MFVACRDVRQNVSEIVDIQRGDVHQNVSTVQYERRSSERLYNTV